MKTIIAYTDGGCRGNGKEDAIGAYGITMSYTDPQGTTHTKEISKAFKGVISLSGANANPTSGIIIDVRYPNSFKGGGTVLKTQKWNK